MSILSNNDAIEDIKCWVNNNSLDIEYVYTQNGELVFSKYTEIEDSPPLLYNSKKNNLALKNYRIYGNTISSESVGDLVESGEHSGEYVVPVKIEGKNLLDINNFDITNTVKCTASVSDNILTIIATSSDARINQVVSRAGDEYIASFGTKIPCVAGKYYLLSVDNDFDKCYLSFYNSLNINLGGCTRVTNTPILSPANSTYMTVRLGVENSVAGVAYSTKIMLCEYNSINEPIIPYEPYHEPIMTNLYLPEQIKMVGDEAEYIDFGEQKQHRVRKNLFSTELEQGNISTDGILVDSATRLRTKNYIPCEKGDYVLSFSGENIKFGCRYYDANYNIISSTGWIVKNSVFIIERINTKYIKFNFTKNDTTENISPSDITDIQLEKGSTATEYEPYIENTELDVTLPTLPTLSGTNILSVNTNIQPSSVYLKGKITVPPTAKIYYYSQDGLTLLYTEFVTQGEDGAYSVAPTKASTAQYNYTFVGWNTSPNQTTATLGCTENITSNINVYAAFSESVRTYTVYFYNGETLLQTVQNVPYGGSAAYTEATPTKEGYNFTGWSPAPTNISGDTSCYAQFE